jgi:hypothetical protein
MAKSKGTKKSPSRKRYEEEHPTVSFRLDRATYNSLQEYLSGTGCSFADFVKDALGREESMVDKRVRKLASRKIEESKKPLLDLELYKIVLDLARWAEIFFVNLPDPMEVPCPDCLFPSKLHKNAESKNVTLKMLENGNLKCPECGLIFRNPPQLAWTLFVKEVVEEFEREKPLQPEE